MGEVFVKAQDGDDVFGDTQVKEPNGYPSNQEHVVMMNVTSPDAKYAPREDRLNTEITASNAQGLLPPEACIFVAKLVS